MSYVIGLTGGIGSGKTLVSDYFATLGVPIIDTDVIARQVVQTGQPALQQLVDAFGAQILHDDGSLNRDVLRQIAFANSRNTAQLDAITHPAIRQQMFQQIADVSYPYCVVVIPLLMPDTGFDELLQRILVVISQTATKIARVQQRSNLSPEQVQQIMDAQISDTQRLSFADDVIHNDGSIDDAQAQVEERHQHYLKLAKQAD